jgi:ATP-dependent Clp protease ATP-binding subunit ClpA
VLVVLRAWFLLTLAYGIGFAIFVSFAVVYGLISGGKLPDKEAFFAFLFIWLFSYIVSLFMFWYLPSRSFFRRAILSHMLLTTIWFLFVLVQLGSFLDSLLFIGLLLGVPFVLGLIIANWLTHSIIAGLSQFKRKLTVKVKPPKTLDFAEYGKWVVVGQDYAIDTIQKVLTANTKLADRGDPRRNRILASFLFVGPTGVGKTETAKALASWLSQDGYDSLRIDANQFSDRESTWTLLGSPKGYIGSETPGLLPDAISQNPKQVILIDEIEKADQGFYQFLLQMLDEGYVIERSTGNVYYLKRAIVIITSNLENKRIAEIMETLSDPVEIDIAVRKTLESAKISFGGGRSFRITPEFLGRIDAVIPFRSLGFEDLVQIAYRDLRDLGVDISYERARELTQKYYPIAREYGVRYFLKKVQEDVLTQ